MKTAADILAAICGVSFSFGVILSVVYNKYRIRKIIKCLQVSFTDGTLTKLQLQLLLNEYTSFFSYLAWFPDIELYPSIYNRSFTDFRRRSKIILLSAICLIALGTICGGLSDLFAHNFIRDNNMSAAQSIYQRHYTAEEYFAFEEQSNIRHEYYHGEIFPLEGPASAEGMAGGTKQHNRLIQNCAFGLRLGLQGRSCEIYAENVRLGIEAGNHYSYPDVVVSCDPRDDDPRTVHSPVLLIEVLSKSTEARDRGWKFEQSQLIPSLQQYVLVSQYRILVDSFVRTDHGTWELTSLRKLTDVLVLPSLQCQLSLTDIYERINIPPLRLAD